MDLEYHNPVFGSELDHSPCVAMIGLVLWWAGGLVPASGDDMAERALVIVPTYNERANIERLISAVLHQDPRLDVLVVDDNSPDGTGGIVEGMAARDPRSTSLHRPVEDGIGHRVRRGIPVGARA